MTVLHPDCAAALSETTFRWPAAYIRGSQAIRSRAGWPRGEIVVLSDAGAKPRCLRVMRRTGRHEHRARAHPTRMRGARDAAREAARHGDRRACLAQSHADYPRDIPLAHAGYPTCTCGSSHLHMRDIPLALCNPTRATRGASITRACRRGRVALTGPRRAYY